MYTFIYQTMYDLATAPLMVALSSWRPLHDRFVMIFRLHVFFRAADERINRGTIDNTLWWRTLAATLDVSIVVQQAATLWESGEVLFPRVRRTTRSIHHISSLIDFSSRFSLFKRLFSSFPLFLCSIFCFLVFARLSSWSVLLSLFPFFFAIVCPYPLSRGGLVHWRNRIRS